jgi:peptide/nickel transport system permease protein
MAAYVARRVLSAIVMLALVTVVAAVIFTVLPDGPSPPGAATGFFDYLGKVFFHGSLGYSNYSHESVLGLIASRVPATLSLILGAGLLGAAVAVPIGVLAARRSGMQVDRVTTRTALVIGSTAVFWIGLVLLFLFSTSIGKIAIFPGAGSYVGLTVNPAKWFTSLLLPWLVLAAAGAALYVRLVRGSMLEVIDGDRVRAARGRGLPEQRVVWRHGVPSALAPLAGVLGVGLGALLGAAVLVETAFNIPGIGRLSYNAIRHSDLATVEGVVLLAAIFVVVVNLIAEIGSAYVDPRVRLS